MTNLLDDIREVVAPIEEGLKTTLKHLFREPTTVQYPEVRQNMPPRARWRHILRRYEGGPHQGLERCIGCSLCAAACPAQAIFVQAAENTDEDRRSPGERYAEIYQINMLRCIFCGFCEEACPVDAVVLTDYFELSDEHRDEFIYGKERLLVPPVA
jgi:NADH-quinone oxidoreductase subunit I